MDILLHQRFPDIYGYVVEFSKKANDLMYAFFVKSRIMHIRWYLIDKYHSAIAAEKNDIIEDIVLDIVCKE